LKDYDALAAKVAKIEGVIDVRAVVEGQVLVSARGRSSGVLVRGMSAADIKAQTLVSRHVSAEAMAQFADDNVLIGDKLAFRLGVNPGDEITILTPQGQATAFGTVPRVKTYKIAGTFDVGMYEYDSSVLFMPLDQAQLFFAFKDAVSYLEVMVTDPDRVRGFDRAIADALGPSVSVSDWQRRNLSLVNAVEIERNVMFLILTLIILVAAFNIISSMIMLVKDKTRDIAVLRTMGATRGMVLRIFMLSGASIGVVGTLAGFVLGVAFAANLEAIRQAVQRVIGTDLFAAEIYFFTQIPAHIEAADVVSVLAMAFGLSFLATLYPSWRAARLDPVEALRYE
ncbi:MAG TPA: lipoprotein-releasing ABC transporter permease subunit, partial [Stellaceae bacterium]|nr:lipoprotein-releasing ABC transporter permease subunit [Stellaceae bacterium]